MTHYRQSDDGPDLTLAQCAAILPLPQEIVDQPQGGSTDPLLQRHIGDACQLVVVLQLCIEKDVNLLFGWHWRALRWASAV
ncbi:hypothetical protein [Streptomyces torulosus]|uniref:hypothetical protein n=1 Tax=Streptomyces torulosus TaxID=68276 RepID=UPI0006EBCA48|nr:hypothetical protein [Streptomyces torulosus]